MVWTNAEGGIEFQISVHMGVTAQTPSRSLHCSHRATWYQALLQSVNEWNTFKSSCMYFPSYFVLFQQNMLLHLTCNHEFTSWCFTSSPVTAAFHHCSSAYKWEFEFHLSRAASEAPGFHILAAGCSCVATIQQLSSRCVCLWEVLPLALSLNADRVGNVRA